MLLSNFFSKSAQNPTTNVTIDTNFNDSKRMALLAFLYLFGFAAIAIFFLIIYAWGEAYTVETVISIVKNEKKQVLESVFNFSTFLSILGVLIVIAFAGVASGAIIGFLFGIPHSIDQGSSTMSIGTTTGTSSSEGNGDSENLRNKFDYKPSTNLEQIADWLTKIIVGVGLIEIHKIIFKFNELCISLGAILSTYSKGHNGSMVVGCCIILFSIFGFLLVYLWTHIYLLKIQNSLNKDDISNTINTILENADSKDKHSIDLANKQLTLKKGEQKISVEELVEAFKGASKSVLSTIFFKAVSIRKQNWNNPDTKFTIENTINIFMALIKLDVNFEVPENFAELGFVLKDQEVPDYENAILNFDEAIRRFKSNDNITNKSMIYFNRAYCKIKLNKDKKSILEDLTEANKKQNVADIIIDNQDVKNWKIQNNA